MAGIRINNKIVAKGRLSIVRSVDFSKKPPILTIEGKLATHRYLEEINSIESERFFLYGVKVFQESFGSEDFDIIYSFTANSLKLKGGESNLTKEEIIKIEDEIYNDGGKN